MTNTILVFLVLIMIVLTGILVLLNALINKNRKEKKQDHMNYSTAEWKKAVNNVYGLRSYADYMEQHPRKTPNQIRMDWGFSPIYNEYLLLPSEYNTNMYSIQLKLANAEINRLNSELDTFKSRICEKSKEIRDISKNLSYAESEAARWEKLYDCMERTWQNTEKELRELKMPEPDHIGMRADFTKEN